MKISTLWLVSLVLWTSLMVPLPLSNAAVTSAAVSAASPVPPKTPVPAQPDNTISSPSFMDAVNQWIKSISGEQGYQAWKQATWTSQPLGPGTHGWIVLIQSGGQPVGYMVIHAADPNNPTKFHLTEYGSGSSPLFSMQTLYQSLVQLELINTSYDAERLYLDPLHSVWKVTSGENRYYIDAKTGESLPLQSETDQQTVSQTTDEELYSQVESKHTVTATVQLSDFDPYERLPWVKGKPVQYRTAAALQKDLELQKELTYTAQLYNGKVTVPFAVTGYQQWSNEQVFLLLEQNGQRAIPYDTASKLGKLYP
ncbi:MAG: hypothetical protein K0S39_5858 [Paenibacillus sp.]|jgi:hypothetical protein|nr:hypothetical protein [Paenibacillus sp.]